MKSRILTWHGKTKAWPRHEIINTIGNNVGREIIASDSGPKGRLRGKSGG